MHPRYFEQLHREESQHYEWRLLDEALARRSTRTSLDGATVRKAIGQLLIHAGTKITGDDPHVRPCSQGDRDK
jgi:hypothetical protein